MISLNEKEKRALATLIQERIDEHLERFPYARYPLEPLEEWKQFFCDPATVQPLTLKKALGWQFGGWQRKTLPSAQTRTIATIVKAWPEFTQTALTEPHELFHFWETQLTDWNTAFGAVAFLLHLQRPDNFEIVDRHRVEAMLELLKTIGHSEGERTASLSFSDFEDYTLFFRSIFPKLSYGNESRTKLDRFLKAYGNRHAYKLVSPDFKTKEPTMRVFSWEDISSKRFRLDQILNRSNCDVLFTCFLLMVETLKQSAEEFTIGEIVELLPVGTAGICNEASFNYALVSLFSGQKQRDFWIFVNPEISRSFTEQANHSTRDMRFYLRHSKEKVKINPKYVNQPLEK